MEEDLSKHLGITATTISTATHAYGHVQMSAEKIVHPEVQYSDEDSDEDLEHGSQNQQIHRYRPLKPDEIRLLIMNPGKEDDAIECYLEHYHLNSAQAYLALSYVWGDASNASLIRLDGYAFQVTSNLRSFLKAYRTEKTCPVLWIDALCINQNDIPERNSQIRLMKRVYEGANHAVIWLGEPGMHTSAAIALMNRMGKTEASGLASYASEHSWVDSDSDAASVPTLHSGINLTVEDITPEILEGVRDLLARPWWTRIWVYQEATAPTRSQNIMLCGPHQLSFPALLIFHHELGKLYSGLYSTRTATIMDEYSTLRNEYHWTGTSNFLRLSDLLPTLRSFESTNPRDKLYALIPTSIDGGDLLDVDYSLSVEDVYTNAACSIIKNDGNLNFLGHCTAASAASDLTLPSWVPDWTVKIAPEHFYKRSNSGPLYAACGNMPADFQIDRAQLTLRCEGVMLDVVEHTTSTSGDMLPGHEIFDSWLEWISSVGFSTPSSPSADTQAAEEILLRTLVADCGERTGMDMGSRIQTANFRKEYIMDALSADTQKTLRGPHPAYHHRKLFLTRKGYLGLGPKHVLQGDNVSILKGGSVPVILRKNNEHVRMIGEAYVHNTMDGEAIEAADDENFETVVIH